MRLNLKFSLKREVIPILAAELAECGLACVAMIANSYSDQVTLLELRRQFSVSVRGTTIRNLTGIFDTLNMTSRVLKVELENLKALRIPCILHWNMNHFVVLESVRKNRVTILDPSIGRRYVSWGEMGKMFTGVALEVTPSINFKPTGARKSVKFRELTGQIIGLRESLIQLFIVAVLLEGCVLISPLLVRWVIDYALATTDQRLLLTLGLGFAFVATIRAIAFGIRGWLVTALSADINFQWVGNVFSHLLRLPMPFFEKRRLGDIVSRFNSVSNIQRILTTGLVEAVIDGILSLTTLVVMFAVSWKLALLPLIALVVTTTVRSFQHERQLAATREGVLHAATQQTHFLESVRGIQSIRLFGRGSDRVSGWLNLLANQFNADLVARRYEVHHRAISLFFHDVERIVFICLAAAMAMANELTLGGLFAVIAYRDLFNFRTSQLVERGFELGVVNVHAERLADIVLERTEVSPPSVSSSFNNRAIDIAVNDVSFRYSVLEAEVLSNVSLIVKAGECVAITGPSGCGKTTLAKIMLGLLEPTHGEVYLGGYLLDQVDRGTLRAQIGTVMQEDYLFLGSVYENISFFDPSPDLNWARECAIKAAIDDEIQLMPMGYYTFIGDIGSTLSGGQRQRLLLARALYKKPTILILDEATSHLDSENEAKVNRAINQLRLTRIIIAHRENTIASADRVVRLEHGRIVTLPMSP